MNILYLGAFPPAFLIKRSGGKIDSLYRASEPLLKGLKEMADVDLKVITSPDIFRYPRGPFFIKHEENREEGVTMVSMLNIPFIKLLWSIVTMTLESCKHLRKYNEEVVVIIPYLVYRHVITLWLLHKIFPKKVIQTIIVPDLFFPKSVIGRFLNRRSEKMASKFDCFILYTEKMSEKLCVMSDRYVVIEGFREISNRIPAERKDFRVVYAGSLNLCYGIGRLLDAASLVDDPDIQFHFYGAGNAEAKLREACKHDDRLHYHGRVNNAEATEAIYLASVLINPRNAHDGEFTEYSFPSKDIEYMATGIPSLLCKLPGMPKEYYGHFIDIGDGSPEKIAAAIMDVKKMGAGERVKIGNDSRDFIVNRMNIHNQTMRIVELLKKTIIKNKEFYVR